MDLGDHKAYEESEGFKEIEDRLVSKVRLDLKVYRESEGFKAIEDRWGSREIEDLLDPKESKDPLDPKEIKGFKVRLDNLDLRESTQTRMKWR